MEEGALVQGRFHLLVGEFDFGRGHRNTKPVGGDRE